MALDSTRDENLPHLNADQQALADELSSNVRDEINLDVGTHIEYLLRQHLQRRPESTLEDLTKRVRDQLATWTVPNTHPLSNFAASRDIHRRTTGKLPYGSRQEI